MTDLISRADAIEAVRKELVCDGRHETHDKTCRFIADVLLPTIPSADAVQGWIPLNKQKSFLMMPDELVAVNVTWVNHIAPPYYKHIEDVPFVDSAVYYRGKWYWWDATVIDVLAEYGEDCNAEQIDKDIEILAWMPLPKPYKGGDDK